MSLNVKDQLARSQGADVVLQAVGTADIMAFMEIWIGEGWTAPVMEGLAAFNLPRLQQYQAGVAARPGGIACYVRENFVPFVALVDSDCTNFFAVPRVNKLAGFEKYLYLIVTYIAPSSSSISVAAGNFWGENSRGVCAARVREGNFTDCG